MKPKLITSLQNDLVKDLVRLRDRRHRDRQGLMLIEEPVVIERALAADYPLHRVCFCPEQIAPEIEPLLKQLQHRIAAAPDAAADCLVQMTPSVMAKVAYRDQPEGLLVVAPQVRHELTDLQLGSVPLLIVLEALEKPGNLGAVLRLADGVGADGVILCDQATDLFNPNVLRASRGAFFNVRTATATTTAALAYLRDKGLQIVAAGPDTPLAWDQVDLTGPVALALGTEHHGLSPAWLKAADRSVAIPMLGVGDSLNVASSAAVLLYEALRQRRAATRKDGNG